jgi:hypothetical protein
MRKLFKSGEPRPANAGRKKGTPNKTTAAAKEIISAAFDELGGLERLVTWANKSSRNLSAFYTKIWTKIIPTQITGAIGVGPLDPAELNAMRGAILEIAAKRAAIENPRQLQ